ncbi:MAG: glycine--tRNA ligase subunit beta [Geminicoccaceae bacterium]|nr:glycine--tRNA ligase subunit beta [Geminicoccaceae bacterium]MDW8368658.1 glycine--tRNA ligase subunit beta [Geminicoccaceae bacterium]
MAELLLELFAEEMPARMQERARADLAQLLRGLFADAGLAHAEPVRTFATPQRLVAVVEGLPQHQPDRLSERRGPREDAPVAAIEGFKRALPAEGVTVEVREEKKGRVLWAIVREPGIATRELLAARLPELLARFPWPKSMRWGTGEARWVRPLRSILCLFDGEPVPFAFAGVESGTTTRGHRFHAPAPLRPKSFAEYERALFGARVVLDPAERRRRIVEGAERLAAAEGLRLVPDEALVEEIVGLVEWPVPLLGRIDPAFMDIPSEVLVLTMRQNQRYLALESEDGRLAPCFVLVANIEARDGGSAIVAGNERVLRARLWDARFFWEQDKKHSLESRLPKLAGMVFHEKLGSQGERVERLVALAGFLCAFVPGADRISSERAALLAKADLVSGMVGEFPELQGIMGGHYARVQGEPEAIARAIAEHYAPKGPEDRCPSAPTSVVVALADRLDHLVGFFAAGIRPTGTKDPFALRRAALGIIRLLSENRLRLPLRRAFDAVLEGYGARFAEVDRAALADELLRFLADRLVVHLRAEGVRHDHIAAVLAVGLDDDLVRLQARVAALRAFLESEDGRNLLSGYRRAANIVAIEERKDGRSYRGEPSRALLRSAEEMTLFDALEAASPRIATALAAEDWAGAMAALAALRRPIDAFFDRVMVNAPEPELRVNRLFMLARIRSALGEVADFALIEEPGRA